MILLQPCLFTSELWSQTVDVQILSIKERDTILVNPVIGNYVLISGKDTLTRLSTNEVLRITRMGDHVFCKALLAKLDTTLSSFNLVSLESGGSIKLKNGFRSEETYAGNFQLSYSRKLIPQLINTVNIDSYVSRVLIEEVGYNVPEEYLKIQAIISRTYAVRNLGRHEDDGFDLCSKVHCQVYHGKKKIPSSIHTATASTSGTIITHDNGKPILATFHANCGGTTANSEHVWNNPLPYLVSTIDTFCLSQRSAVWNKDLELSKLKKYVRNQTGLDSDSLNWESLVLDANRSGKNIDFFGETFSLPMMRRDLGLRSTFFTMKVDGDKTIFSGRGFGHGVGLCQQGAINMARQDFNHKQILGFYFKGAKLESISKSMLAK
ncbi:MAG: stage II sporulation protein D [Granulosicoccus sp.]|jgi:stage II sporulation protein D